jgi:hypothetical protein
LGLGRFTPQSGHHWQKQTHARNKRRCIYSISSAAPAVKREAEEDWAKDRWR